MTRMVFTIFTFILVMGCGESLCSGGLESSTLTVTKLRCEYRGNPVGIDTAGPRLSWVLESEQRGQKQTAYRVLVASSKESLEGDEGNLWDTGKVLSEESIQVKYGGRRLGAGQQCFWKVRVWDKKGRASGWSGSARWSMGLLRRADWQAKWIAGRKPDKFNGEGAEWIWYREGDPRSSAPAGTRYFRRKFKIDDIDVVAKAQLLITADNEFKLYVNGNIAGTGNSWQTLSRIDIKSYLQKGDNFLSVEVKNTTDAANPAGLIGKLIIEIKQASPQEIVTNQEWRSSKSGEAGWQGADFDDRGWEAAQELGAMGVEPWGDISLGQGKLPIFRKDFQVAKPVARATTYICGLGHYELFLNGEKVGNRFLDPAWSVYEKTVYYTTYDITNQLQLKDNAFGVMLGKGFYSTQGDRRIHGVNIYRPLTLLMQTHIEYTDGTEDLILSDSSWKVTDGPIAHNSILGGSDYDARFLPADWNKAEFDDTLWQNAEEIKAPKGELVASYGPAMSSFEVFEPVKIAEPEPGYFVYDFGQNASARPRIRVQGKSGQTIRLTPSEQRFGQNGNANDGTGRVDQAGVGRPLDWEYTLKGGEDEVWMPQFHYSGYQYIELSGGVPENRANKEALPVVKELVSVHVRNKSASEGSFTCSNELFNKIYHLVDWAVRSNMGHVLTDCPHREKLGWLEVSYLMGPSIAGRYDIARFYTKKTRDIRDSQDDDGVIYTVAPNYPLFSGGFRYTPEWGAAGVVVPWQVYQWYGDKRILSENYATMKKFVDYMQASSTNFIAKAGLGDWYDYGHGSSMGPSRFTPPELTATATFYLCSRIVSEAAGILGNENDQTEYAVLAENIGTAFNATYFDGIDTYANKGSCQTANSMALVVGLVESKYEKAVLNKVIEDIRARGNQQTAGDIGHWYLLTALSENNHSDVIFDMTNRKQMGSYGYIVKQGWTAMPEAWDAQLTSSMNHCMLGHIQEWFQKALGGIRPDASTTAFKKIIIKPEVVGDLKWVRYNYDSMYGNIVSNWRREEDKLIMKVKIPANTTATIYVPAKEAKMVKESGKAVTEAEGIRYVRRERDRVVLAVESGSYTFVVGQDKD
jgi:alpha-L-rhamnosidase